MSSYIDKIYIKIDYIRFKYYNLIIFVFNSVENPWLRGRRAIPTDF